MELFIFARFHTLAGKEDAAADALRETVTHTREEPGCIGINAFRSNRDSQLFYIHSRWIDDAAFDNHIGLPHTLRFIERIEPLIDHPLEVVRTMKLV